MFKTNRSSSIYTILIRTITMIMIALLWVLVSPITAFFWTLFLLAVAFRLDSQMFGIGALMLLILIPITQLKEEWHMISEQLAIYVFYLLCIVVVLQLLEIRRDPDNTEKLSLVSEPKLQYEPKPEPEPIPETGRIKRKTLVFDDMKRATAPSSGRGKFLSPRKTKMIEVLYKHPNSDTTFKTKYHVDR